MFKIIGLMLLGVLTGWLLRRRQFLYTQKSITLLVWLLLFTLGLEIGADKDVISSLPTLGGQAVIISLLATIMGILLSWLFWKWLKEPPKEEIKEVQASESLIRRIWNSVGDNILILAIFGVGVWIGTTGRMQALVEANVTIHMLYCLMFVVGFSIGNNSETLSQFKQLPKPYLFLPFLTILGSLIGGLLAGILLRENLFSTLSVSAGQAYYSLSSVIISDQLGPALGAIALLANIFRELFTVLLAPFIARLFGPLAVISSGGATTMDVSLPFILKVSGPQYLVTSIYHGFVCDLSVPFLVTFFAAQALCY